MGVGPFFEGKVHGGPRGGQDRGEELLGELVVEAPGGPGRQLRRLEDEQRPAADVDRAARARLVHRDDRVGVAVDAGAVAERVVERLPQRQPRVLGGVVRAGLQVAGDLQVEVEAGVARQEVEHVVEEADAGRAPARARAVQPERQADVGLLRGAGDLSGSRHRGAPFCRASIEAAWTVKPSARAIGAPAGASAVAAAPMWTSAMRRRKWRTESEEAKRAAPPVGSEWLEPAT